MFILWGKIMKVKKEFYLPNKGVLSLYNISYLESDFNLITDKISKRFGNKKVDINGNLLLSNGFRSIKLKDKTVPIYRIYCEEDSFLKPLTSINYGYDIINFKEIDVFLSKNNNFKYLKALEEYLQIFNFEYKENYIKEQVIKMALDELEKNREFYKVERFLDQKYFLELALEADYKRKMQMANANARVLKLGNRKV